MIIIGKRTISTTAQQGAARKLHVRQRAARKLHGSCTEAAYTDDDGSAQSTGDDGSVQDTDTDGSAQGTDSDGSEQGTDSGGSAQGTDSDGSAQGTDSGGSAQGNDSDGSAQGTDSDGSAQGTDSNGSAQGTDSGGSAQGQEFSDLNKLAKAADRVLEARSSGKQHITQTTNVTTPDCVESIQRNRPLNPRRNGSSTAPSPAPVLFYHTRFSPGARKCQPGYSGSSLTSTVETQTTDYQIELVTDDFISVTFAKDTDDDGSAQNTADDGSGQDTDSDGSAQDTDSGESSQDTDSVGSAQGTDSENVQNTFENKTLEYIG
ncbi:RNA binding protein-like protein [Elysia marginata]|uniref:RNA binding protein-like protein n=1 Tax=Elysia marginata TaxID=1093978 RepID=A0AAV4FVE9_9GAST|nr:RNA binding protein-like protein [Elysia marginata]